MKLSRDTTLPGYLALTRQALLLFSLYRIILATGFILIAKFQIHVNFFSINHDTLYFYASHGYLLVSLVFLLAASIIKQNFTIQATLSVYFDILAIIALMHASGGMISGIGILLVIVVAAHSLVVPGKLALLSAAFASSGLLFEHIYMQYTDPQALMIYHQVGLLGSTIFLTTIVTTLMALKTRKSEISLQNQSLELAESEYLNSLIISKLQCGILVIDHENKIALINNAAKQLLGLDTTCYPATISDLPQAFQNYLSSWQLDNNLSLCSLSKNKTEIRVQFNKINKARTIIYLYNHKEELRQAHHLKLASMGQLTANIAHEIRNPLGAISFSSQLLAESNLTDENKKLVSIIQGHTLRMNQVIQNSISLSRRESPKLQSIEIVPFMKKFIKQLTDSKNLDLKITTEFESKTLISKVDPSQLTQILVNLCENGLRYSLANNNGATLHIKVKSVPGNTDGIYLDIIDQGPGIPENVSEHIFEPFYTTNSNGSGLGLYIAKELSEMNGASLDYIPHLKGGSQFRLTLMQGEA